MSLINIKEKEEHEVLTIARPKVTLNILTVQEFQSGKWEEQNKNLKVPEGCVAIIVMKYGKEYKDPVFLTEKTGSCYIEGLTVAYGET